MASVAHHQTQSRRFLSLARADLNAGEPQRAVAALARAASHAATAAVFHWNHIKRPTRRKLTNFLFILASDGNITFGAVRAFRQIYQTPDALAQAEAAGDHRKAAWLLRRARNRIAALVHAVNRAIAGRRARGPRPGSPAAADHPDAAHAAAPAIVTVSDILDLPNYAAIVADYKLANIPIGARPDPHHFYAIGQAPRPCDCHPETRQMPDDPTNMIIAPPWRQALTKALPGAVIPHRISLSTR